VTVLFPQAKSVISTEATDSLIVRRATDKPALSEAEWDSRICPYITAAIIQLPFAIEGRIVRATQQPVVGQFGGNNSMCRKDDLNEAAVRRTRSRVAELRFVALS
jgi:hypothetical protein